MITLNTLLSNPFTAIKGIVLFVLLVIAAIQDIKKREVSNWIHLLIAATAFINFGIDSLIPMIVGAVISALPLFVAALIKQGSIGGADIKLMAASGLLLGVRKGIAALIVGLFLAVIITTIVRKIKHNDLNTSFPLVPYLAVGNIIAYLL